MSKASSRREFFQKAAALSGVALLSTNFMGLSALAEEKRRAKKDAGAASGGGDLDLPLAVPGQGNAGPMNYQHQHSDVKNAALKAERNGTAWDKQFCSGCMLYNKVGNKAGAEVGKCSAIPGVLVKGAGWCTSWAKKA